MENTDTPAPPCSNCAQPLPAPDVIFCPHCGQKNSDGRVSLRDFLGRFFQHFTHLDNKFVRTVHDLFVPGKMTGIYFRGKRKRYPHPVQLFFIVMFFFLLTANHYIAQSGSIQVGSSDKNAPAKKMTGNTFFVYLQQQALSLRLRALADSLPARLRDAHTREAIDSLLLLSHDPALRDFQQLLISSDSAAQANHDNRWRDSLPPNELWRNWPVLDSVSITLGYRSYLMSINDVTTLSEEELLEKYQITGTFNRILVRQGIKTSHNPAELMKFYAGSFSWTVLAQVACMAAFLILLYRRQRRYYVEHFVFLMHWHSAVLLLLAVLLAVRRLAGDGVSPVYAALLPLWLGGSLFWAMWRYYRAGFWGTAWRWMLFIFVYLLAFTVFFALGLLVALLLF